MSQWTHVSAIIRFDGIKGTTPDPILGHMVSFDDPTEAWDTCDVPCGSEGSLQYILSDIREGIVRFTSDIGEGIVRFTAAIWGDLRDYGDENDVAEIESYLTRIVDGHIIRSGIAEIRVDGTQVDPSIRKILRYMMEDDSLKAQWHTIWEQSSE